MGKKMEDPPHARLAFSSLTAIANAPIQLRRRIMSHFQIDPFLLSRACLESNGFFGSKSVLNQTGDLAHYNHWSRFIVKQTYETLRPKPGYVQYYKDHKMSFPREDQPQRQYVPVHNEQSTPYGWTWYEMGFFVHWKPPHSTTILCFDVPQHLQASIQSSSARLAEGIDFSDPYAIFPIVFDEVIALYDDSVWSLRNHISAREASRLQEPDYPLLHEIARHVTHVSETLMVASKSIRSLLQHQQDFMNKHFKSDRTWDATQSQFHFRLQIIQNIHSRSESNRARLQNEISLAFHLAAQRDSQIQVQIGKEANKEAASMRTIAVVTLTILPATFISSLFSMSFFHFEPAQGAVSASFTVSEKFWMYWAIAAPLTIAALALWTFWGTNSSRETPESINRLVKSKLSSAGTK
ncbi:MAG: hypothetical protein M1820_009449 [Bogoriella megaspora]|nr:MAG: hypothetical protein M1820_009449 [Bogoriella megaspora]